MPGPFDELENEAEQLEKRSKEEFSQKNFNSAIAYLEEAREIYTKLGFQGKIGMISQRIARLRNLVQRETKDSFVKTQKESEVQQQVDNVIKEGEMDIDKKMTEQKVIPPEIKRKLDKVSMILEKAEKEEKFGKYSRVISRYEYILELYRAIPKDLLNLSNEIYTIEKKLSDLRLKQ